MPKEEQDKSENEYGYEMIDFVELRKKIFADNSPERKEAMKDIEMQRRKKK